MAGKGKDDSKFEDSVEKALADLLGNERVPTEERIKLLNVCVRWAAVKAKLVLPDHGLGFTEDE